MSTTLKSADRHQLEFSGRWALREVVYRVGYTAIAHEDLMRVVAGLDDPSIRGSPTIR